MTDGVAPRRGHYQWLCGCLKGHPRACGQRCVNYVPKSQRKKMPENCKHCQIEQHDSCVGDVNCPCCMSGSGMYE